MHELGINPNETLGKVNKKSVYQIVNDLLINEVENGRLPWRKEWQGTYQGDELGVFFNYRTKRPYKGVNPWLIGAKLKEHHCNWFLTKSQIENAGGKINKDATKFMIVYNGKAQQTITTEPTPEFPEGEILSRFIRFLREYTVYNLADTDLDAWKKYEPKPKTEAEKIETCEKIYPNMPKKPVLKHGGDDAYYTPSQDRVQMPHLSDFKKPQNYYSTLFHELIHSTMHVSRLNRPAGIKGTKAYALEELVAEIGASYICAFTGIFFATQKNSAAYLRGWGSKLGSEARENKNFFFKAASESQKAANYILSKLLKQIKRKQPKKQLGHAEVKPLKKPVKPNVTPQAVEQYFEKPQNKIVATKKSNPFTPANEIMSAGSEQLPGDLGEMLGPLGNHYCAITLEADKGAGKSQLAYQFADAFSDMGKEVAIYSLEMLLTSPTVKYYRDKYIKPENQHKVKVSDQSTTAKKISSEAHLYDVAIIDSFNELEDYQQDQFGQLFKAHPEKKFIALFQSHSGGQIRGGIKPLSDAYINLYIHKVDNTFKNNYAECTKNRFGPTGPKYNIASKSITTDGHYPTTEEVNQ